MKHSNSVTQTTHNRVLSGIAMFLFITSGILSAQSGQKSFVPFNDFVASTRSANSSEFRSQATSKVKDAQAFEEMRQHILNLYQGVDVTHSFVLDGDHFDCVPIEQQPAVRTYGLKGIASPPPQSVLAKPAGADASAAEDAVKPASLLDTQKPFDEFGNSARCEQGTTAMLRVTLETLTRFQTLHQFFQKSPNEQGPGQSRITPGGPSHKYSETFQYVNNHGGNSNLNIWSPYVNKSLGEIFSLSQEWYVGGISTGVPPCGGSQSCSIQTEEVGWVVYPGMFGDEKSHFFIFSTADGYATGCWNNSCGDFVQVADSGLLGASLTSSVYGGAQYEFSAEYYLYNGNWWLAYQGTWVGYYPGAKYHGGQNTRYAQVIEFGTESVGSTVWPPEGSGIWPWYGFGWAAFQRNLFYINTSNGGVWDSLTPYIPSPNCYSIAGPYNSTGAWTVYFYDGGPGGYGC